MAQYVIGREDEARIAALCEIAKRNGSALTLSELLEATSLPTTEEDLEVAWKRNPALSRAYTLDSGWILEDPNGQAAQRHRDRKERAKRSIDQARGFAGVLAGRDVRMLAVSGGTSYRRAGPKDDIDLFCITATDTLWLFMVKALLLARFSSSRGRSPYCFSYVLDERRARSEFREDRGSLFARDALMANVLAGAGLYYSLLKESVWMESYFPRLYASRLESLRDEPAAEGPVGRRVLNMLLYYTVGTYVRVKAFLLNGRYRREARSSSVFRADVRSDCCIYESTRYQQLKRLYDSRLGTR